MGASISNSVDWLSASDAPVLLWLHDLRCPDDAPDEDFRCSVSLEGMPAVAYATRRAPAVVHVGSSLSLDVEFHTLPAGGRTDGGRKVGALHLSLADVASHCDGSLLRTWFPLGERHQATSPKAQAGALFAFKSFERALRSRWPLACLSLAQLDASRDDPQSDAQGGPPRECVRFPSLFRSRAQHGQLLQALYRHCRDSCPSHSEAGGSPSIHGSSRQSLDSPQPAPTSPAETSPAEAIVSARGLDESAPRLREMIAETRRKAEVRFAQVDQSVRMLRRQLEAKRSSHEELRRETAGFRREADALEGEGAGLLSRLASACARISEQDPQGPRREAQVLAEQKQTLMTIIEGYYGGGGQSEEAAEPAEEWGPAAEEWGQAAEWGEPAQGGGRAHAAYEPEEAPPVQAWKSMLPRPSELRFD